MTIWTPNLSAATGPKHRALSDAIAAGISDGTLPAGTRMPPQRELAFALGLSLGTVTRAYKAAEALGLLTGEVGRGTFVKDRAAQGGKLWSPARQGEGDIGLVMNLPPKGVAGSALAETLTAIASDGSADFLLDHHTGGRIEAHAQAAALWLNRVGLTALPENVVLTNGAQHGLLAALMALARPGDTILAERLTYPPLCQMAHYLGLKTYPVELDAEGMVPESLDDACRRTSARLLYTMPTLHSPTGSTMSARRRAEVAVIARRHALDIVEDDVFGYLPEVRPLPLMHFAPERTVFLTSASKCMAPGLRVGMMLAPPRLRDTLRNVVQMSCWMPAPLTTEIVHRWINDGTADRLNSWLRQEMAARLELAHDILGQTIQLQEGPRFHLWLQLPERWSEEMFQRAAEARGVKLAIGALFLLKPGEAPGHVRLALGYETSRARLERGLSVIADLLDAPALHSSSIV